FSEQSVNVTLSATVSATGSTVNAGTVTFQVKNGSTNVGSAVTSGTVCSADASATDSVPARTAASAYTIVATYNPSSNFNSSSDISSTLPLGPRNTLFPYTTLFRSFSEQSVNVTLSATVSATGSTVNAGTVTFQVKNGSTNVGSAVTSG